MALRVEFTVEPFTEGSPGPHVEAAVDAARAHAVDVEFGPFGTTIAGPDGPVLEAVADALRAAVEHGASRVSVQLSRS